ncbi:MAG: thioredoxin-dependent thiol peroxidase [SAR202 cluster bacterium]|nr:thioredoxin-dependent thiol peroxidase [SAR202 cluster bacterium]
MAMPNVGAKAPDFSVLQTDGKKVALSEFKGKKVVLYFYPKDDTSGCTKEACSFRDSDAELRRAGAVVLGVSADDVDSHQKFTQKFNLNFPLLADTDKSIINAYGVWGDKVNANTGAVSQGIRRITYLIDEGGKVQKVWPIVTPDGHVAEVLNAIKHGPYPRVGAGKHTYEWVENFLQQPDSESARKGWSHHGIVVSETSDIITYHQEDGNVMRFDRNGVFKSSWQGWFADAHGMTIVKEGDAEALWIADNGRKRMSKSGYEYPAVQAQVIGQAVKTTLDGQSLLKLPTPPLPAYEKGNYMPTWVAVNEERLGGNGDVWVADGYGQSMVHRFSKDGKYLSTITGEEGSAGKFNTPHSICIDRRKGYPELYIADRSNGRVQVYGLDGKFRRVFGKEFMTSPSGIVTHGQTMVIAELKARITLVDINDNFVCYIGANESVATADGWPNNKDEHGHPVRSRLLQPGKFNSPHGIAVDKNGNILVAEWLIGGRFIRLEKATI